MAKAATNPVETLAADAQKTMTDTMTKMTKTFEDLSAFGQDNLDAAVKSSEIATKAAEGFTTEVSSFSKKSFEETVAAAKDLSAAKNVTELMDKQSAFMTSMFDAYIAQATKMNEMMVATSKDVMEPINARVVAAQDMAKSYAA
ncbi:MAG: phasin family protein [Pseudomonadota bacterium]